MLSAVIICPTSQVVNVLIYNCSAHRNSSAIVPHATWQIIEQVFILTVLTIIILGAFLGNLLVIVSIIYFTKLRTLTNAFLLSLAVADFLVGIIVMPFSMIKVMFGWYFGKAFCTIHTVMDVMLCTSSIMNLSCIAFDRYYAVCYRLRYRFRVSRKSDNPPPRLLGSTRLSVICATAIGPPFDGIGNYSFTTGSTWLCVHCQYPLRSLCLSDLLLSSNVGDVGCIWQNFPSCQDPSQTDIHHGKWIPRNGRH